jgi:tRNA modification GTPase
VLGILERIETNIEFNEGVSDGVPEDRGKGSMEVFLERLKQDIERRKRMRLIEHGVKVVIAGPVNAGKSTLFNTLIKKNRAIVHRTPGTTRDIVSERLWLSGHEIRLYDSAGIRKTGHGVEREGIERSRRAMRDAGVILWVTAADEKLKSMETKEVVTRAAETETICIINKTDINDGRVKANEFENRGIKTFFLSLKEGNKKKIDQFVSYLEKNIEAMHHDQQLPEMLFNARHEEIGKALIRELSRAGEEWERPEIAAIFLKRGLACMDEYFGKVHSEEVLNGIFKNFCIGK